jgi:hypothetical protein
MTIFDAPGDEVEWGTDAPISLPHPKEADAEEVDVGGGFVFTTRGLRYDLTEPDRQELYVAPYGPRSVPNG